MIDSPERIAALVQHFERVEREHMQGLPILNPRLVVEAVGARDFGEHCVFVLISPWFMNLVLLPGTDKWDASKRGASYDLKFPSGPLTFTVCHDDALGVYLTAVLFRAVTDFPDREHALAVANQVAEDLFLPRTAASATHRKPMSRRSLLTGRGAD